MQNKEFRKKIYFKGRIFFLSFFFLTIPCITFGESSIIINEIYYDALGSDSKKEWIEIINTSSETVNIEGWKFFEGGVNHGLKIYAGDLEVLSGQYVIIADNPGVFLDENPEYGGTLIDSSFSLSNSGEVLALKNGEGDIVYEVNYSSYTEEGISGHSLEYRGDGSWGGSCVFGGTPGQENCAGDEDRKIVKHIQLSELFPNPELSPESSFEYVELYNYGDASVSLSGWILQDKKGEKILSGEIQSGEHKVLYKTVSLNNSGDTITLVAPDEEVVDETEYKNSKESWSWSWNGKKWLWTPYSTPNEKNKFIETSKQGKIQLNEILANPKGDEEKEFIELYNGGNVPVDLQWWSLQDESKSGSYTFEKSKKILPGQYLFIERKEFTFALNNTEETVRLVDPHGKMVDTIAYEKTKEGTSWNFDGKEWRMSKFVTPGEANVFNDLPEVSRVRIDKKIYKDVWAEFSVKASDRNKEKVKVRWEFGDGKKSYKKETRHKYKKTGKYTVTLTLSDESEDVVQEYPIQVKKYPKRKVKVRAFAPNPSGKDSDFEWIRLHNYSKKDVNLKGWSMATGKSSKKVTNHPIYEDVIIEKGESYILTREDSKFSLNNKKGRIELRYPNGKVAYKVKYKKEEGVQEDEVYMKEDGGKWHWELPKKEGDKSQEIEPRMLGAWTVEENMIGGSSFDEEYEMKKYEVLRLSRISDDVRNGIIQIPKEALSEKNGIYVFNTKASKRDHYAVQFIKTFSGDINGAINRFLDDK